MGRLDGKVALITGAARGIGKAIALRFAREGADIIVDDILTQEMEATAAEIRALGRKVLTVKADVTKKKEVVKMVATALDAFPRIDILVNNAGVARRAPFVEITEEDWDAVLNVDLKGVFLCTQAITPHMIAQKYGKIINLSSVTAFGTADANMIHYASAKAGVANLTKIAARALGAYGINVNAVAPGAIITDLSHWDRTPAEFDAFVANRRKEAVLGRTGTPEDVANLALFLASEEASFITGQVIICDGGRTDKL